ncbi:hypothetical protein [Thiobacillus sp. 0-1251]|uniref:hypothetical protein n=1 Tax=Thiobacillus sp. 0-1251 TaxID=1895858 RepID=UPI000968B6CD|nr:hypothetical protein [Thiobacillus sp. 0-1251]OJY55785.1 MAG: hypothetical protein BGP19_12060 [Thiobacillus sp. 0-1251]
MEKNLSLWDGGYVVMKQCAIGALLISALTSCNQSDQRLTKLDAMVTLAQKEMKPGEVRNVALPALQGNEHLVMINGQYGGYLCDPVPFSKTAANKVMNYAGEASYPAFFMIVKGDDVASHMPVSTAHSNTFVYPRLAKQPLCALVADQGNRYVELECVPLRHDVSLEQRCDVRLRSVR